MPLMRNRTHTATHSHLNVQGRVECSGGGAKEAVHQVCLLLLVTADHQPPLDVLQVDGESHPRLVLAAEKWKQEEGHSQGT